MIIAISGRLGSGKDEIGKIIHYLTAIKNRDDIYGKSDISFSYEDYNKRGLEEHLFNWRTVKFADSLKDIICRLINCTREQLEDRDFKEVSLGDLWKGLTPRQILQKVGTDLFRDGLDENVWVNSLFSQYREMSVNSYIVPDSFPKWVITDMRFPNEMEAVKKHGGITVRVDRPEYLKQNNAGILTPVHPSETSLDEAKFDYVIDNTGTIEELIEKVKKILIKEKLL